MSVLCPICSESLPDEAVTASSEVQCTRCGSRSHIEDATVVIAPEEAQRASARTLASALGAFGASDAADLPGYEVERLIARGGMGVVYKARHIALGRTVAIKMPLHFERPSDRERFLREAKASAHLRHPNICPIHEVGEHKGRPFIVMGFIEGATLWSWSKEKRPNARQVAGIMASVARTVHYAHQNGIIHRDIKPPNILVESATDSVMLMDFGLAKNLREDKAGLTGTGQVMGTPAYMAPEQAAGRTDAIGPGTDVYALGVVLYELLGGRPPFLGSTGEIISRLLTEEAKPLRQLAPHVHRDLETICMKALSRETEQRYSSAAAMAEDLDRFCAGEAILARPEGAWRRLARKVRSRPVAAALAGAVVLLLIGAAELALSVRTARQAASLTRAFEAGLASDQWSPAHYEQMDALAARLAAGSPERARELRARLNAQFDLRLRDELRQPSLGDEQIARMREEIAFLASRDPALGPPLLQALQARLKMWQVAAALEPPFSAREEVFGSNRVQVSGDALLRTRTDSEAAKPPLTLSAIPCLGHVRAEAVFGPSWPRADEIGLALNASERDGYSIVLDADRHPSSGASNNPGGAYVARILRNRVVLREQRVGAGDLGTGPLRIQATREGNRLSLQINDLPPVTCLDPFPLSPKAPGTYGLWWPAGVALQKFTMSRQAAAAAPSLLERGDDLYAGGRIPEASAFYHEQALLAGSGAAGQEARYKEALCLLDLKQTEEAAGAFEALAVEPGAPWPVLAASRLWLIRLSQKRLEDADAIQATLTQNHETSELLALIPEQERQNILNAYNHAVSGFQVMLNASPDKVRNLERAVAVAQLLDPSQFKALPLQGSLVRAYRIVGRQEAAIKLSEELLARARGMTASNDEERQSLASNRISLCEEYGWMMRVRKTPQEALKYVEEALQGRKAAARPEYLPLLVERARIHAACGRWEEAEKDLEDFLAQRREANGDNYYFTTHAWLLLGFLRERRGDAAGAVAAWGSGYEAVDVSNQATHRDANKFGSGMSTLLNTVILGALSDRLTERDLGILFRALMDQHETVRLAAGALSPANLLREPWRTPRGHELARHLACRDLSYREHYREGFVLIAATELIRSGFQGKVSPEEEELVTQATRGLYEAISRDQLGRTHLLQFALAWSGVTNSFGWGGLKRSLDSTLQGPVAYILGCRYRSSGKAQDGAALLAEALAEAPAGSVLQRLAQGRLASLRPPPQN